MNQESLSSLRIEIVIIDNSCSEKNKAILEKGVKKIQQKVQQKIGHYTDSFCIRLKFSTKNIGYTKANNWGVSLFLSSIDFLFIVNPDIVWRETDTVQKLLSYMQEHDQVGICAPLQKNMKTKRRELSVREFPHLLLQILRRTALRDFFLIKKYIQNDEMQYLDSSQIQDVDWIQSSFFLIEKKLWDEIGGFNESYFLFMADTEICFESWKKRRKVVLYPHTTVGSDGKRCSDGGVFDFFTSWVLRQHLKDAFRYCLAHFFEKNPRSEWAKKKKS